jgi:hypothetical protein
MYVLYSTLLHLPPIRFRCVGGCWDRTQGSCDFGIGCQTLWPLGYNSFSTRLHLMRMRSLIIELSVDLSIGQFFYSLQLIEFNLKQILRHFNYGIRNLLFRILYNMSCLFNFGTCLFIVFISCFFIGVFCLLQVFRSPDSHFKSE